MTIHTQRPATLGAAQRRAPRAPAANLPRGRIRAAVLAGAACAFAVAPAGAHELPTYRALVDALMAGQSVTTLLDLARCTREGSDAHGPKIQGGSRITRFLIPGDQYVAFADTHHTLDAEEKPVIEYIRYRAMPDGSVTVRFARQTGSSDEITPRGQFNCRMTDGVRFIAGEAPRALPLRTRMDPAAPLAIQPPAQPSLPADDTDPAAQR